MKRVWAFAPLVAFLAIAAAAGFILTREASRETVSAEGLVGRPAPNYTLAALRGEAPITPERFAGRAYVVNLFASWCAPCREEHRHLMALSESGAPILGVAYKDRPERAGGFLAELGDPYEIVGLDPDGRIGLEMGISGVPETFVIGPDGTIRALHRGPLTAEIVRTRIAPALSR